MDITLRQAHKIEEQDPDVIKHLFANMIDDFAKDNFELMAEYVAENTPSVDEIVGNEMMLDADDRRKL